MVFYKTSKKPILFIWESFLCVGDKGAFASPLFAGADEIIYFVGPDIDSSG